MSEEEVREEEGKEVPEALEEAPPDFIVDINGLEIMVKISDLLYEATRSGDPTRYIEEIERLSSSVEVAREGRRAKRPAKAKAKAVKKRTKTVKRKKAAESK